jgi:hypothetical protein
MAQIADSSHEHSANSSLGFGMAGFNRHPNSIPAVNLLMQ